MPRARSRIIVVYGIPCVGKSTMAVKLAEQLGTRTVIATDYIREVQRQYISPGDAPALAKVTHNAWQLYGPPNRANIERGFLAHVHDLSDAIRSVVAKLADDGFDAILEGAHFHGAFIADLQKTFPTTRISAALLTVKDAHELRHRIETKETDRAQSAQKKEWRDNVDAMLAIQDFLIRDARGHAIPIIMSIEGEESWPTVYRLFAT